MSTSESLNLICVENLVVARAGATHHSPLTFREGRGGTVLLIGTNGSGKSSILKTLAGIDERASGTVVLQGRMLFVPQREPLFRGLSIAEHLRLRSRWTTIAKFRSEAEALGGSVDLLRRAGTFSGGEQRLIALALALSCRPDVLLLDEPLAQLHGDRAKLVLDRLATKQQDGMCIVIAEHRLDFALRIDRLIDLDRMGARPIS